MIKKIFNKIREVLLTIATFNKYIDTVKINQGKILIELLKNNSKSSHKSNCVIARSEATKQSYSRKIASLHFVSLAMTRLAYL